MRKLFYGSLLFVVFVGCSATENNFPATMDESTQKTMEEMNKQEEQAMNINVHGTAPSENDRNVDTAHNTNNVSRNER